MENYVGKRLDGRYEIHDIIGVGGMAVVYKAYDNINNRIVSVKILREEYLANAEFIRRFKNESKAISILSHPNIVKVYDVKYGDRLQYIVMEYVEGITLKEYIKQQGKLETREAVHFMMQILRALQHAHDKGVVHRDVKPQNILLLSNGTIKVADFGIATFSCGETKTMTDAAIGSVHYISPEQARGDATDDKTDIYAAGVVLYEMLTGRVPFESDSAKTVALMQLQKEPTRPRDIDSNIPVGLEQIALRAMQKNPADRYQSAAEMLLDVEEFKRNPNARFDDDFFGRGATKFVPAAPEVPRTAVQSQPDEIVTDKKKATLIGVASGLAVVLAIALATLYFFTDIFNGNRLTVPNFMGKNYATEIQGNNDYRNFEIEVEYVQNSTYEDGIVFNQDPRPGQKVDRKKSQITLSVASTIKVVPIPDVTGTSYIEAKKILENKGFVVSPQPQTSAEVDFGTVISTYPEPNTEVEEGTTIVIYYASDEKLISVPKLIGWDLGTAEQLLKSVGLELDKTVIRKDSDKPEGEVIEQDLEEGTKVESGTKVTVTISTGVPESTEPEKTTATVTITLPANSSGTTGTVSATLNNDVLFEKNLLLDGSTYEFTCEGSGANNTLKVFANGSVIYTAYIDFTSDPAIVRDGKYSVFDTSRQAIPKVVGLKSGRAKLDLTTKGFANIKIVKVKVSDALKDDVVISQSPEASSTALFATTYPLDTEVILTVGEYTE